MEQRAGTQVRTASRLNVPSGSEVKGQRSVLYYSLLYDQTTSCSPSWSHVPRMHREQAELEQNFAREISNLVQRLSAEKEQLEAELKLKMDQEVMLVRWVMTSQMNQNHLTTFIFYSLNISVPSMTFYFCLLFRLMLKSCLINLKAATGCNDVIHSAV